MKQPTRKQRIGLTVSVVWILVIFTWIYADFHERPRGRPGSSVEFPIHEFIVYAILPVLIIWAVWWIWRASPKREKK